MNFSWSAEELKPRVEIHKDSQAGIKAAQMTWGNVEYNDTLMSNKSMLTLAYQGAKKEPKPDRNQSHLHVHKVCNTICERLAARSLCGHDGMWNLWAIC